MSLYPQASQIAKPSEPNSHLTRLLTASEILLNAFTSISVVLSVTVISLPFRFRWLNLHQNCLVDFIFILFFLKQERVNPHPLIWSYHAFGVNVKGLFKLFLVGVDGLEPSAATVSEWCSNQLNYTPMECPTGFEPAKNGFAIRCLTIQPQTHWRSQWDLNPCCWRDRPVS